MLKEELTAKLKELNLTKKEFCKLTGIAYSTISNWNDEKKPIPPWVDSWIENHTKVKYLEDEAKLSESEEMLQNLSRIEMMLNNKKFNLILKFIEDMKALDDEDK